jgi:D-glycero-alpha-D-manno-heptose-7-phosphate kinase
VTSSALAVAPLRISFVGGGSDIENYYRDSEGRVVSCAINKYVFVHAKLHDDSFGERYRISYSKVEHVQEIAQIENEIVRNCLEFMKIDLPVQISTLSDLPAGTGLGSSSSFTVALLLALHELKGEKPTKYQLAEEACHVEIELLKHPIGKQDQFASSFGGINFFRFKTNGKVSVEPVSISSNELNNLLNRCCLYWTRTERPAAKILADQAERAISNLPQMHKMVNLADEFRDHLQDDEIDWGSLADLINESWDLKQSFSPLISSSEIENMIKAIKQRDQYGAKLLGAGGGGFVLAFNGGDLNSEAKIPNVKDGSSTFIPSVDHLGARIISKF